MLDQSLIVFIQQVVRYRIRQVQKNLPGENQLSQNEGEYVADCICELLLPRTIESVLRSAPEDRGSRIHDIVSNTARESISRDLDFHLNTTSIEDLASIVHSIPCMPPDSFDESEVIETHLTNKAINIEMEKIGKAKRKLERLERTHDARLNPSKRKRALTDYQKEKKTTRTRAMKGKKRRKPAKPINPIPCLKQIQQSKDRIKEVRCKTMTPKNLKRNPDIAVIQEVLASQYDLEALVQVIFTGNEVREDG